MDTLTPRQYKLLMETFTEEEMRAAHDENGDCGSCGWHAMFSEHSYTRNPYSSRAPNEFHDSCKNPQQDIEGEDNPHRGCYIYPTHTQEKV